MTDDPDRQVPYDVEQVDGSTVRIRFAGELDMSHRESLDALIALLRRSSARDLLIDLSQVEYMDSFTLGVLVRLAAICRDRKGAAGIERASAVSLRVLHLAGLHLIIPILPVRDSCQGEA